jgi:outer membrane protein assembly factor BamB
VESVRFLANDGAKGNPEVSMRFTSAVLVLLLLTGVSFAGDVGWRTDGTGRYPDAEPPVKLDPEKPIWAAAMPAWSNASPVVLADRIIVCAEPATVLAVDKKTGALLWRQDNAEGAPPLADNGKPKVRTHPHNGYTSATPASDGKRVFVVFGTGVVAAYDIDGKHLWTKLIERPRHIWGNCASPLLVGGKLLVHVETLVALDPADGKELWRQPAETWPKRKKQWGSPVATRIGETDVVVSAAGNVIRVSDGKVLFPKLAHIEFCAPVVADGVAYFIAKSKGRAIRLPKTLDGQPEVLWETVTAKERYYGSPVVHEGLLYAISQRGAFSAFEAKTGKELYRIQFLMADTVKNPNAAYTSVTLGGKNIYFAGMNGLVVVVEAGREYKPLARNQIEKSLRSNPVFEGQRMFFRAPGKLYCFGR